MAYRLSWSARGLAELQATLDYVAVDAPANAQSIARLALQKAEALQDQPRQGRKLPENTGPREIREVFVFRWRLIYEVAGETVTILALHHSARLLDNVPPL